MALLTTILLGIVALLQLITILIVVFSVRKTAWAARFALAAKGESHKASVNTTRQLEYLAKLHRKMGLQWGDLQPTRGWAASPDFLNLIFDTISRDKPHIVVELGSGVSTIVVASALKYNGHGRLLTVDHDEHFLQKTNSDIDRLNLGKFASSHFAPLVPCSIQGKVWQWYDLSENEIPDTIDILIVDGPPEPITGEEGRYPALEKLYGAVADGGSIILDDTNRAGEKRFIHRFCKRFPEIHAEYVNLEKGATILRKRQPQLSRPNM